MRRLPHGWTIALAVLFYGLLVFFLARYLRGTDWRQLARLEFIPLYLLAAAPLSLASRLLQPIAWRVLIEGYGDRAPPYAQITRVYATSWMGRYIPGKVAGIGAKVFLGREYGMRPSTLAATSIAEAAIQLATALVLAFVLLGFWGEALVLRDELWILAMIGLAGLTVLLAPPVFNGVVRRARSAMTAAPAADIGRLSVASLLSCAALWLLIHAFSGPPIYFVLKSMYPALTPSLIPALTAAVLFAGTLGTLAVFAPAGLGVREGILIVLLGVLIPRSIAVAAVVVLRLWSIAMDLLYYGLSAVLDRARPWGATDPDANGTQST
jgi:uncharacterized membrane protein YbhN (UPF0104 family)